MGERREHTIRHPGIRIGLHDGALDTQQKGGRDQRRTGIASDADHEIRTARSAQGQALRETDGSARESPYPSDQTLSHNTPCLNGDQLVSLSRHHFCFEPAFGPHESDLDCLQLPFELPGYRHARI